MPALFGMVLFHFRMISNRDLISRLASKSGILAKQVVLPCP
jgi:hypothetical protein